MSDRYEWLLENFTQCRDNDQNLTSVAISLKRIADILELLAQAQNLIPTKVSE